MTLLVVIRKIKGRRAIIKWNIKPKMVKILLYANTLEGNLDHGSVKK